MGILKEILDNKRIEVAHLKESFKRNCKRRYSGPSFYEALSCSRDLAVIGEVKMKSPSQGVMAGSEDPVEIAKIFSLSGISALSVLTDRKFFGGSFEILKRISREVSLPILCKDFIIDRIQIDIALESGASAVLLISEILSDRELASLYEYTQEVGLDALVEVHLRENVERAVNIKARIIGINNRNLDTLEEKAGLAGEMAALIPPGIIKLGLSGCRNRASAGEMAKAGLDGVLIGGALMKSADRNHAAAEFLHIPRKRPESMGIQ